MRRLPLLAACALLPLACSDLEIDLEVDPHAVDIAALEGMRNNEPIRPLEPIANIDAELADIGGRLFHDPGLSGDGTISCASCHSIPDGGDDGLRASVGIEGQVGGINAPTVLNAAYHVAQFWDGRAQTLEDQAKGPLVHPLEMGGNWDDILAYVASDPEYARVLGERYEAGVTQESIAAAIAEFERTLVTLDSPFDHWLRGEDDAISTQALRGYERFKEFGCASCHQGRNVGGNMYQRFGLFGDYLADQGRPLTEADNGRFNVTGEENDRHVFRVPSLRNVALTAPYFHDGSARTLHDAVSTMGRYQLGRRVEDEDVDDIVAFLETLTGTLPNVEIYQ